MLRAYNGKIRKKIFYRYILDRIHEKLTGCELVRAALYIETETIYSIQS